MVKMVNLMYIFTVIQNQINKALKSPIFVENTCPIDIFLSPSGGHLLK